MLRAPSARRAVRESRAAASGGHRWACGSSWPPRSCSSARCSSALGVYRYLYPEAFETASEQLNWMIGGINTLVLLVSSLTIVLAVHYARHGPAAADRRAFWPDGRCWACCFLVLQGAGILPRLPRESDSRLAVRAAASGSTSTGCGPTRCRTSNCFSVLLDHDAVHALHVTIGIGAVLVIMVLAARGHFLRRLLRAGRRDWRCTGTLSISSGFSCCRCCTC